MSVASVLPLGSLLDALIASRRMDGSECRERGHDLSSKAIASGWEVGDRLVVSLGAVCRVCEKPVTVNESLPMIADAALAERAQRESLKDLKNRLRAMDRNRRG